MKKSAYERFISKIKLVESGCWEWVGAKNRQGYGFMKADGRFNIQAHRFSYIYYLGNIPKGLFVLHKCDNPSCVSPAHLFLGTNSANSLDRDIKGRNKYKLNALSVRDIRTRHRNGESNASLAREYGITKQNMHRVLAYRTWKWVE